MSSVISYSLRRAYPWKRFTTTVVIAGILVTALVSFISVGTSGYQLALVSRQDPNTTESETTWLRRRLGSIIGSIEPTCQPTTIPLNTALYTNNTALSYTLTNILAMDANGIMSPLGSLAYKNNPLQNCTVNNVYVHFEGMQRPADAIAAQQQDVAISANISCVIETTSGRLMVGLSTTYDYLQWSYTTGMQSFSFLGRNKTGQASLYWAESLLFMYWVNVSNTYFVGNKIPQYQFYEAFASLQRTDPPIDAIDVESLDFFSIPKCYFVPFNGTGQTGLNRHNSTIRYCKEDIALSLAANGPPPPDGAESHPNPFVRPGPMPSIWLPLDRLAKSLYYTVLADLGQIDPSIPNILTSSELLTYFTQNFSAINASMSGYLGQNIRPADGLENTPFSRASWPSNAPLEIRPSTLTTVYLCQVPELKSTGSLIVAVLIANLVLLHTIWQVFKFTADQVLERRHPDIKYCEGCLELDPSLASKKKSDEESTLDTRSVGTGRPSLADTPKNDEESTEDMQSMESGLPENVPARSASAP